MLRTAILLLSTFVTSKVNDALPVNVLTRPDGGTHVQAGPINVLVQRGNSILRPFGLFVDVPAILQLRVASHPVGGTGVHVNVPFLDAIWAAAKRPLPPPPDDDDYDDANEEGEGAGAESINKNSTLTNSTNITVAKTRFKTRNCKVTENSTGDNKIDSNDKFETKAKRKFELPQNCTKVTARPGSV